MKLREMEYIEPEFLLPPFRYVGSQKLSGMLLQPYDLYKEGWADAYLMGMVNQVSYYAIHVKDKTGFNPEIHPI